MLASLIVVMTGCDITSVRDAVDDFDLIIQLEPIETYVVAQIVDAETGDLVDGSIQVSFSGPDASSVIDFYSDPVTALSVRGGMLTVGVHQGIAPAESSPVRFSVTATADGYEEAMANVRIDELGEHALTIPMVPVGLDLEGSGRAGAEAWLNDGRTAAFSLTTTSAGDAASAGVSVPAGVEVRNAAGKPLAGSLTVKLAHYDGSKRAALAAFPGGFTSMQVSSATGSDEGAIIAAGFTSFSARSSEGEAAAAFSEDVSRTLEISSNAINPKTGAAYRAGDRISVLQFDASTGTWEHETEATIEQAAAKSVPALTVSYPSRRTGFQAIGSVVNTCATGMTFEFDRNGHTGTLQGTLTGSKGSGYSRNVVIPAGVNSVSVRDLPADVALELTMDLPSGGTITHPFTSTCGGREAVVLTPASAASMDVTFSVDLSCTLKLQPPFNATLNYKKRGTPGGGVSAGIPDWTTDERGRVNGGTLTIPGLYPDQTYRFILVTPEETAWEDVTITGREMHYEVDVPNDLCRR